LLDFLRERGAYVIATTHYPELKSYAEGTARVQNASVEFDVQTLSPTFRLMIGTPGRSNALAIAERLGMPREVLDRARTYVTPQAQETEALLQEIAREDRRFKVVRVDGSESKAQNVNAALSEATGEFIGIFDADHHPDPHCFRRAWRWLASGYDVVQGHCMVRNGDETWVSRMVAVEFEAIYAVSHPGRARLHDFGIFGGSNGYWKARLLHETRMHASMLTEDIDSSMRVVEAGITTLPEVMRSIYMTGA
jgi:hypothetical protein